MADGVVCPTDIFNNVIGIASKLKFQDATSGTPIVSPKSAASVTLEIPVGATCLHICCDAAWKYGEGTLAGTAGNGYVNAVAGEWATIPVLNVASVVCLTASGNPGSFEFFFEINNGSRT